MQPTEASQADCRARLISDVEREPIANSAAPWRVAEATVLDGRAIHVRFRDGLTGYVDMGPFLERPDVIGSPFEPLRQEAFFLQMAVRDGLVQWPNGADLSPDSMYDAIRESGRWVV